MKDMLALLPPPEEDGALLGAGAGARDGAGAAALGADGGGAPLVFALEAGDDGAGC
ncbi:MAG: hypothetical protein ACX939_06485 [Hyphococcus sp.]